MNKLHKKWLSLIKSIDCSTAGRFESMNREPIKWEEVERAFNLANYPKMQVNWFTDDINWRSVVFVEIEGRKLDLFDVTIGGWTNFRFSLLSDDELIKLKPVINVLIRGTVPMTSKDGTGKLYGETFLKKVETENDGTRTNR